MKKLIIAVLAFGGLMPFLSTVAVAQVQVVGRANPERKPIMDALRPAAKKDLGPPVEFVVRTLNISGNFAYAEVEAQRKGGGRIDIARTPFGRSNTDALDFVDCCHIQSILLKKKGRWVEIERTAFATDYGMDPKWCRRMPRGFFGRACS